MKNLKIALSAVLCIIFVLALAGCSTGFEGTYVIESALTNQNSQILLEGTRLDDFGLGEDGFCLEFKDNGDCKGVYNMDEFDSSYEIEDNKLTIKSINGEPREFTMEDGKLIINDKQTDAVLTFVKFK